MSNDAGYGIQYGESYGSATEDTTNPEIPEENNEMTSVLELNDRYMLENGAKCSGVKQEALDTLYVHEFVDDDTDSRIVLVQHDSFNPDAPEQIELGVEGIELLKKILANY